MAVIDLTDKHLAILGTIGAKGANRETLGEHAASRELGELVGASYVVIRRIELEETVDAAGSPGSDPVMWWMLTEQGAAAVGVDPDHIGRA
jgi:hypothetical protein